MDPVLLMCVLYSIDRRDQDVTCKSGTQEEIRENSDTDAGVLPGHDWPRHFGARPNWAPRFETRDDMQAATFTVELQVPNGLLP
ncbi:hypothetical protein CIB48_g9627 [Xylaria polymorpha]|nr:hypothetical protein CIB48_g9627 [Xylaria polymorpha]